MRNKKKHLATQRFLLWNIHIQYKSGATEKICQISCVFLDGRKMLCMKYVKFFFINETISFHFRNFLVYFYVRSDGHEGVYIGAVSPSGPLHLLLLSFFSVFSVAYMCIMVYLHFFTHLNLYFELELFY